SAELFRDQFDRRKSNIGPNGSQNGDQRQGRGLAVISTYLPGATSLDSCTCHPGVSGAHFRRICFATTYWSRGNNGTECAHVVVDNAGANRSVWRRLSRAGDDRSFLCDG